MIKKIIQAATVSFFGFCLSACPLTRTDVQEAEQKKQIQDNMLSLQKTTADSGNRFSEIESDLRHLSGKVETLEDRIDKVSKDKDKSLQGTNELVADGNKRNLALQEEVTKLAQQVTALQAEVAAMKTVREPVIPVKEANGKKVDAFSAADELFKAGDFKKAALSFQKYREAQPKGKKFSEATYKLGVCFQELGMKDEAKTFFEEVIAKFSQSPEAKKAKSRLKSLK